MSMPNRQIRREKCHVSDPRTDLSFSSDDQYARSDCEHPPSDSGFASLRAMSGTGLHKIADARMHQQDEDDQRLEALEVTGSVKEEWDEWNTFRARLTEEAQAEVMQEMMADRPGCFKMAFDVSNHEYEGMTMLKSLQATGLTQDEWDVWMAKLTQVQKLKWPRARKQCACILVLPFWTLLFPVAIFLCKEGRSNQRWSEALLQWQNSFNEECLQQHGIYCKTQSFGYPKVCWEDVFLMGDIPYERWIAFAVTPSAIERLKRAPHLEGHNANCSCCGQTPESELCMHPEHLLDCKVSPAQGAYVF